ncbi:MAG: FHA domain-containing protein [Polyangiaceae bacterium]
MITSPRGPFEPFSEVMGTLENRTTGERLTLGARCLFGRHPTCDVRMEDPRVSGEHASLHFRDGRWELRDLGSRNGTFVGDRRLGAGERVTLDEGRVFSLGGPSVAFVLVEAAAPRVAARHHGTGELRVAVGGLLSLPDDERPLASVFEDATGRWMIETSEERRPVHDQEVIDLEGEVFTLHVPAAEAETWQPSAANASIETVHLRFTVSRDEERVETTVVTGDTSRVLPSRSHHYLLVTLARAWLNEASRPFAERGWVGRDALCKMLGTDLNRLNVDIHRARKQLATLDIQGAANLIERRQDTGEIRIGVRSVEVARW